MKKILAFLLAVVCVLGVYCYAEDADDSESSLMELFMMETRSSDISVFEYGDYDGDGIHEAFALLPKQGWNSDGEGYYGELWFVSPRQCTKIHDEDSCLALSKEGAGPMLFTAEVWYGGSGSTSYVWGVSQSSKAEILGKEFEGISGGEMPNEFYMYPSAFDQSTDGTGHTWKRYYFFLDGLELKEYGGLWISRNQLEEVEGGEAILQKAEEEGWTIGDIYYRENGIINVNLHDEWSNDNLTLRFDGTAVVDTGERFGGVYKSASGLAEAVYPETFEHEVSENTAIGRAIISASVEQENKTEAGVRYLRVTNDVNMRDKPNLNGGVITSIPKGTTIEFLNEVSTDERGVDWYRMRYGNREGWTSSKYTVFDDGIGIVQDSQTKQTSKQTSGTAKITGNVNMREEPNLNGNVITSISKGATVDFLGDVSTDERGVDWYRIRYKGNEGWTSSKYTKLN